jgi:dihydroflavonol-4-reductase
MAEVLVTGGTGFLGAHTIVRLLADGHQVRTTLRSLARQPDAAAMLRTAGVADVAGIRYFPADLTRDDGWDAAVAGADYVVHVASPFPGAAPADENDVIEPARDGTLRVLRAARAAGVRRVVLTSSFAAVGYGHGRTSRVFDERDWTDVDGPGVGAYVKSKAIAERAAWDFIEAEGKDLELTAINPVGIFGPVLGPDYASSIAIIATMLTGGMRIAPPVWTQTVDVRDAADLHVRAMTAPQAAGQRYLALAGGVMSFGQIAATLRARLGDAAAQAPARSAPAWLIKGLARLQPGRRELVSQLGVVRRASNEKARTELGWAPRPNEDAVTASGESLIRLGLLGQARGHAGG